MHIRGWLLGAAMLLGTPVAAAPSAPLPHFEHQGGRHALIVDGAPFLMLGAQANNSSNYPAVLPKVWQAVARSTPTRSRSRSPGSRSSRRRVISTSPGSTRCLLRRGSTMSGSFRCGSAPTRTPAPSYAPEWVKSDTAASRA